jgi:Domain of unknown function (DUF4190)
MKICPNCRQTYSDDNLNFCLTDGSFLNSAPDNEPKTVYMDPPRVTNQTNWGQPTNFEQPTYQTPSVWQNQQGIQNQPQNYPMRVGSQDQTLATISMILGIIAVLIGCCYGGIPLGAGAIITGVIALNNEKSDPTKYGGRGLAIAGIVTGAVGFSISILIIFFAAIAK